MGHASLLVGQFLERLVDALLAESVDFQAFNVFNWLNRTYSSWGSGGGNPPSLIENGQYGNDARSFQAGIKYKF